MNRHLQNELQHICPSEADIPPCDLTLQVIKSTLHCKELQFPSLACSCPEHSGYRGWGGFDAILISPVSNTHWISHLSCNFLFQSTLSQKDLVHTLGTFCWRFSQPFGLALSAEQIKAQYRPNWDSLSTFTILNCWLSANDSIAELVTHVSMWGGNWNLCHYELFLSQLLQYACA